MNRKPVISYIIIGCINLILASKVEAISFQGTLFVCIGQQSDLLELIEKKKVPFINFSKSTDAIEYAVVNSSVIITADSSYPAYRTKIDLSFYLLAQKKNLRVFIEYPEYIPDLALERGDFQVMLERAVITSPQFFEGRVKDLTVLNLGNASLIPIRKRILKS